MSSSVTTVSEGVPVCRDISAAASSTNLWKKYKIVSKLNQLKLKKTENIWKKERNHKKKETIERIYKKDRKNKKEIIYKKEKSYKKKKETKKERN